MQDMRGKKILLVEDNEFNQMVAVDTLHDIFQGIEVDVAENGRIAIEKVSANDYSMILMDIQLPDIDGFETTRFIRNDLGSPKNKIRICAMTASVTKERIDMCMASGMNDYLMKPFKPEDLKEKVIRNTLGLELTR
jgi:CheY-like chemotaxis protein